MQEQTTELYDRVRLYRAGRGVDASSGRVDTKIEEVGAYCVCVSAGTRCQAATRSMLTKRRSLQPQPSGTLLLGVHSWHTAEALRRRHVIRALCPPNDAVMMRFIMT